MNVVEGAASLFGPEEVNSDLFALLGDDPSSHTPGEATIGYPSPGSTEAVKELRSIEAAAEAHQYPQDEQYVPDVGWKQTQENYGQQYYENQTFDTLQTDSYAESHTPSHNPYAPASVYAPLETVSYSQPVQYSQLDYSAYTQPDYSSVVQPDPQLRVAPSSYPSYNKYLPPSTNYGSSLPVGNSAQLVPPPFAPAAAPAVTVTRPKVSNAYDPPFPTMSTSSRRAAWGHTSASQSTLTTHSSSQIPSQPPPPKSRPDHVRYGSGNEYFQTSPPPSIGAEYYAPPSHHNNGKDHSDRQNNYATQSLFTEGLLGNSSGHTSVQQTNHSTPSDIYEGADFTPHDLSDTQSVLHNLKEYKTPDIPLTSSPPVNSEKVHHAESHPYDSHSWQSIASYTEASVQPTSLSPVLSETFTGHDSFTVTAEDFSKPSYAYSSSDISYEPYPNTVNGYASSNRTSSPGNEKGPSDPYVPKRTGQVYMSTSPTLLPPSLAPTDQKSNGSLTSIYNDPYAPSHTNILPPQESQFKNSWHRGSPQQDFVKQTYTAPYAPSPSLMGANDPLGRTSNKVPIFSFGFGGKLVTCFHGTASLNTGFDVALSSRNSTSVHIRVLKTIISDTALDSPGEDFPGPLMSDSGAPTSGIVRPGASAQIKNKKSAVIKYLEDLSHEISQGLAYLHYGSSERWHSEDKLVLVKVLKAIVEHDGRLLVTAQSETTVRLALIPQYEELLGRSSDDTIGLSVPVYSLHTDKQILNPDTSASLLGAMPAGSNTDIPLAVTTLLPSALDRIEKFLLCGERQKAYHYALDEKLWAHAMVIASSIDKEAWKEVVDEFLKTELRLKDNASQNSPVKDRNSLRVAYSLFSGQGAAAVQELIPQNLLAGTSSLLQPPTFSQFTPRTPNFTQQAPVAIPVESLSGWAETVSMIISSPVSAETSAALTALGDHLLLGQRVEAAHVCYLLSPQTSPMGGYGGSNRFSLVGSRGPLSPTFAKDVHSLVFSEVIEFALSLTPAVKGQESYLGLPYLQAYRFIRAMSLAEMGNINLAQRYCDSIMASLARPSPYFTTALLEQLKGLSDRIHGVSHGDKSGSWIGAKISKPSLDTIGGWLETRFTKLVAGDTDGVLDSQEDMSKKPETHSFSGPFSHYSTISTTPSARSSPQPMISNVNSLPPRTGSAMAYAHHPLDNSIAASDYSKQQYPPAPRTPHFASQSSSMGQTFDSYSSGNSPEELQTQTPRPSGGLEGVSQEATWWGSSSFVDGSSTHTPTASNFIQVDHAVSATSEGYMDSNHETLSRNDNNEKYVTREEDEDDLGLGNSKRNKETLVDKQTTAIDTAASLASASEKSDTPKQDTTDSTSSSSWLSRWWKRDTSTPGPIKASLGEESAFYYNKDLKKWVNKNSSADDAVKALPPPPPSRAQTASPGMANTRNTIPPPGSQPPVRSASAIDLSTSPPSRSAMRVRSNLVPPPDSAPSTPTGTRLVPNGPSPGRPKSQASKRNVRSRYVDVFQQEQQG